MSKPWLNLALNIELLFSCSLLSVATFYTAAKAWQCQDVTSISQFISKKLLKIKRTGEIKCSSTLEYLELKFFLPEFLVTILFRTLKYVL